MSSKPGQTLSQLTPAILFFVAGAFWVGIVLLGGGVYLIWAAATSLLSGALLVALPSNRITFPLVAASAVFGDHIKPRQKKAVSTGRRNRVQDIGSPCLGYSKANGSRSTAISGSIFGDSADDSVN